jgi:hypothetical protein
MRWGNFGLQLVGIPSIDFFGVQLWEPFGFLVSYYLSNNLLPLAPCKLWTVGLTTEQVKHSKTPFQTWHLH